MRAADPVVTGVLLGDRIAAVAAAVEFLPGQADLVAARAHRGAIAHVGRTVGGMEAPVGDIDDAVVVERAVTLRAIDALNSKLLAGQQARASAPLIGRSAMAGDDADGSGKQR